MIASAARVNTIPAVAVLPGSSKHLAIIVTNPESVSSAGVATPPWTDTLAGSLDVKSARLTVAPPLSVFKARKGMEASPKGPSAPVAGESVNAATLSTDTASGLVPASCPKVALRLAAATELAAVKVPPEMLPAAGLSRLAATDMVALGLAPSADRSSPALAAKLVGMP